MKNIDTQMECVGEPPDPPIVGKVTHMSVELILDPLYMSEEKSGIPNKADIKYIVQEEELGGLVTKGFGTVYSGFARKNIFNGLEPRTMYRYRLKYKHGGYETPWSRVIEVMTTKTPPSADTLHRAVAKNDVKAVKKLLEELNKDLIDAPDKYGYSPIMTAASKGFKNVAEVLVENFADVNFQNSSGKNALMMACYSGKFEMVRYLRKVGASWSVCDNAGSYPIHWAVDGGNVDLIRWMIKDGCMVDPKDTTSGWTPLMRLSSMRGDIEVAKLLVNNGANVNGLDNSKKSSLMMAALNGHTELVRLLLAKNVSIDVKSIHDKTALDFARAFKHGKIVEMLEKKYKEMHTDELVKERNREPVAVV